MCQLFFNIDKLPDYINYNFSNKLNIKEVQNLLDKNMSPREISNILSVSVHRIYDAIYSKKVHYSKSYIHRIGIPIVELDENNLIINSFDTIQDAANKYNMNGDCLRRNLRNKKHILNGHIFYYRKDII